MSLTWFAPVFFILLVFACRGQRQWVGATMVATFFQAASPLLVTAGGRFIGMQSAYLLLPIGMLHFCVHTFRPRPHAARFRFDGPQILLAALTGICVMGAFILPRVFGGLVHVMAPRGGNRVLLHVGSGNIIQAIYMTCNFAICALVAVSIYRGAVTVAQGIRYLAVGTVMAACLGIYQVGCNLLHLPWPDAVINSNLGALQYFNQPVWGFARRMSSTFLEPSMLAMHFLGMFALFALGMRRWLMGGIVLFCLLISTSGTAYAGLIVLAAVWIVVKIRRDGLNMRTVLGLALGASAVAAVILFVSFGTHNWINSNYVHDKLTSSSGRMRIEEDTVALRTTLESWGLGVGIGSTRASSFLTTFLACTGVFGLLCLFGFFGSLIVRSLSASAVEIRSLGLGLTALFVGWLISVPDLAMPMIWSIGGLISGALSLRARRSHPQESVSALSALAVS